MHKPDARLRAYQLWASSRIPLEAIAKTVCVSRRTLRRWTQQWRASGAMGRPIRARSEYLQETKDAARAMAASGEKVGRISAALNIPYCTVRNWISPRAS